MKDVAVSKYVKTAVIGELKTAVGCFRIAAQSILVVLIFYSASHEVHAATVFY